MCLFSDLPTIIFFKGHQPFIICSSHTKFQIQAFSSCEQSQLEQLDATEPQLL